MMARRRCHNSSRDRESRREDTESRRFIKVGRSLDVAFGVRHQNPVCDGTLPEAEVAIGISSGFTLCFNSYTRAEGPAPKGLEDSAQGFNLGKSQNKRVRPEGARDVATR
jgi:hypothetical protein